MGDAHACILDQPWFLNLNSCQPTHLSRSAKVNGRRRLAARRATSSLAALVDELLNDQLGVGCDVNVRRVRARVILGVAVPHRGLHLAKP